MTKPQSALARVAAVGALALTLSACSAPFAFEGTTWYTDGGAEPQACEGYVTLLEDGTFDYRTKCPDEPDFRDYVGAEDDSFWQLEDGRITLSYNGGYNVCEGAASPQKLDLHCVNVTQAEFDRVFVPAP